MSTIKNPILRGFNPDPSIIRVGGDYYIATSTFEWFPGVQIHHSRDLVHWKLVGRPLNRLSQLDMRGNPDSCGVWAPCLSYDDGVFYLVYSNVRSFDGVWKDTPNYLVTTTNMLGDWSEPIFLGSSGFDGSLFHDDDGRKWYLSMLVDHRKGKFFGGIVMQEYNPAEKRLSGPIHYIFEGTKLGLTEAPHLYKKNGYYYLITAEGGTEYGHAVTIARSRSIVGPYEVHPRNPMITCRGFEAHPLQKAGHADMVETADGNWYAVFLIGRPLSMLGRCTLGRETAIEEIHWMEDDWPYLAKGGALPRIELPAPGLPEYRYSEANERDDFDFPRLNIHFQALRVPITEEWCSLSVRPGFLRLFGRESLTSFHDQSFLARRVQHFRIEAATALDFYPTHFQQMAGLVCYYNTSHYHYLYVSADEAGNRVLSIISCDRFRTSEPMENPVILPPTGPVFLKVTFHRSVIRFFYAIEPDHWHLVGPALDGSILSDDYVRDDIHRYRPAFTGSFVGICCQDLSGQRGPADFDWFEYRETEGEVG